MTATIISPQEKDLSRFAFAIQQLAEGRSNATGSVTLTANASTTAVVAPTCGAGSYPFLIPMTASAAAEIGNGTLYISAVASKTFTITHANSATLDRTFGWAVLG